MTTHDATRDRAQPAHHVKYEWDGPESLRYTVIRAVSALSGEEPTALPVLDRHVNTDALESLFAGRQEDNESTDFVQLTYGGTSITIHRNGHVFLQPS